ncbi:prolyl-tRNA synthetase associated domain-containing protein [Rhodospirillum rubrum]|uniref:Ala-tRNA(Pro) hydrolase n=1 Tax=Rhodospirillum rubrum (strain ATCC 11170 / ATH 1.1.1 / DSM 467 / LMG 4362 / NCIMB 8255 / S1) TaxID=269796 RepID=Q2RVC1_RHORT|nr:prolyl-tRNA synthetase associated domain-containing protein [Rhodospirillum rubrum]ABC21924.1 Ala-tRNA(Pro) hydrolase [Rhodospirillum rubrum ATCC 11170]AEO47627.1 ala-tRNA(Pro) hydrolase [Rhodospirillum rubrum F11]MBK5953491.1 prolyl-tRNA synthetase associated domain-containing protein [Rhodospirillum rubrum]QXG81581.1 prolyl-tRNA synthetase associated domain-containing protein [Rhodospirillum rubrum]HAQ00473.1 prolyl-tRNA synthetase associated domain-containing protein [Rhodospirillum rubr
MPITTPVDLLAHLSELAISSVTTEHPPVHTVEEAKATHDQIAGCHCKNLFLKDAKGQLWLVVCPYDRVVDLKTLHRRIGAARLSFGKPELLDEVLGVRPGSVTPFALVNDTAHRVKVVLDRAMMAQDRLNYHPLVNTATTTISAADLRRFLAACGQSVAEVDLETPEIAGA